MDNKRVLIGDGVDNMRSYKLVDYEAIYDELLRHYLKPEYYSATQAPIKCVTSKIIATTVDEYIKLLIEGYINAEIREDLEEYLNQILENEWFHQWPLVRWAYASRSLNRKTEPNYKKHKNNNENIDNEVEMLDALAKEGWPGAMVEVGAYYRCYDSTEDNYVQYVCLCLYASQKGYGEARRRLYTEFLLGDYEKLCEELRILVLEQAHAWILEYSGATVYDYAEKLNEYYLENYKRICKKILKLHKSISERTYMRDTAGKLFWPNGDSPYDIKY